MAKAREGQQVGNRFGGFKSRTVPGFYETVSQPPPTVINFGREVVYEESVGGYRRGLQTPPYTKNVKLQSFHYGKVLKWLRDLIANQVDQFTLMQEFESLPFRHFCWISSVG